MHPWYTDASDIGKNSALDCFNEQVAEFLASRSNVSNPLLLFEERQHVERTIQQVKQHTDTNIVLVPTKEHTSIPDFVAGESPVQEKRPYQKWYQYWKPLLNLLGNIDIKLATVSGRNFFVDEDSYESHLEEFAAAFKYARVDSSPAHPEKIRRMLYNAATKIAYRERREKLGEKPQRYDMYDGCAALAVYGLSLQCTAQISDMAYQQNSEDVSEFDPKYKIRTVDELE